MELFTNLIYKYGLLAMFLIILLEYACFPVSSEIVLPFSGAIASLQKIPFPIILLVSIVGGLIGTSFCYFIGRLGGVPLIEKIKRKFPKTQKGLNNSLEKFEKYGPLAVCVGRVIPICRTYIAFIAGMAKQRYSIFFIASLIGISVWNTILIGLGYVLRENWKNVLAYYDEYKHLLIPMIIVLIIVIVLISKKKKKSSVAK